MYGSAKRTTDFVSGCRQRTVVASWPHVAPRAVKFYQRKGHVSWPFLMTVSGLEDWVLQSQFRLKENRDFRRVFRRGKSFATARLVLLRQSSRWRTCWFFDKQKGWQCGRSQSFKACVAGGFSDVVARVERQV